MQQSAIVVVILFSMTSIASSTDYDRCSLTSVIQNTVHLICPGEKSFRDYWLFNNTLLFSNGNLLSNIITNVTVNDNYTLIIGSVSWDHTGTYGCIRNGSLTKTHHLCVTETTETTKSIPTTIVTTWYIASTSAVSSDSNLSDNKNNNTDGKLDGLTFFLPLTTAGSICTLIVIVTLFGCYVKFRGSDNRIREIVENELRNIPIRTESSSSEHLPELPPHFERNIDNLPASTRNRLSISPSQVTHLYKLPGTGLIQSWLAVSDVGLLGGDNFIAKSVSDEAKTKDIIRFGELAKNIQLLHSHPSIAKQLSVAVSDFPYYIYQEYIEGGNLRHFMLRNFEQWNDGTKGNQKSSSTIDGKKLLLLQFALEVVDGMKFLSSNNYRHPGLCSNKVLLTNSISCKLYDFWPENLSEERLNTILEKSDPPIAWFPTETIFLRQYSEESDIWSYSVLLWEIFSLGSIPYAGLSKDEIEKSVRHGKVLVQPTDCPGGVYDIMLSSWDSINNKRPSFTQIEERIHSILQTLSREEDDHLKKEEPTESNYFDLEGENDYTETC